MPGALVPAQPFSDKKYDAYCRAASSFSLCCRFLRPVPALALAHARYGGLAIIQVFRWAAKEFLDVTDWTYQLNCHDGTEPGRVGYTCNAAMDRSPGNLQFLHGQSSNAAFLAAHAVDSAKKINGFLAGKPVANPGGAQGLHVTESCTSALSVVVLLLPLAAFGWYVVAEARRHLAAQKKRN